MSILEVTNIEKSFERTKVLKDISFSLERGAGVGHYRLLWQRKNHALTLFEFFGAAGQRQNLREWNAAF